MLINEEQKQALAEASYFLGLAAEKLKPINGMLAFSISAQGQALLYQAYPDLEKNDKNIEPIQEISDEVKELINDFNEDF